MRWSGIRGLQPRSLVAQMKIKSPSASSGSEVVQARPVLMPKRGRDRRAVCNRTDHGDRRKLEASRALNGNGKVIAGKWIPKTDVGRPADRRPTRRRWRPTTPTTSLARGAAHIMRFEHWVPTPTFPRLASAQYVAGPAPTPRRNDQQSERIAAGSALMKMWWC